jgi:uncharacterized protein YydD (DUF2326 family)
VSDAIELREKTHQTLCSLATESEEGKFFLAVLLKKIEALSAEPMEISDETLESHDESFNKPIDDLLSDVIERVVSSVANSNQEPLSAVTSNEDMLTDSTVSALNNETREQFEECEALKIVEERSSYRLFF